MVSKLKRIDNMMEIRRRLVDGESHDSIAQALGLNKRTYFRLVRRVWDSDRKLLEKQNAETLMGEAAMMLERWNGIYRQLKAISEDSSIEPEHRMHALAAMSENVKSRVGFFRDSPAMLALQHRRLLEASLGHTASITQPSLNSYSPTPFPPLYGGRQQQQQEQEEQGEEEGDYNRDHEF